MTTIKVGDEVRVFDGWHARHDHTSVPGEVVKLGRTLVRIKYRGFEEAFRIDTGVVNNSNGGASFMTLEQAALAERRTVALSVLAARHVKFETGYERSFATEQIEALAEVIKSWEG